MCKILMFTNFSKVRKQRSVVEYIAEELLRTESDGFGYAIQGEKGIYGERLSNEPNFKSRVYRNKKFISHDSVPFVESTQEKFGIHKDNKAAGPAIFHGRTSTNSLGLKNTHPIQKNGWSLIHNGVVSNHGPEYKQRTDNDTEHLVHYMSTTGVKGIEDHITGYYAIGAISPSGDLHIVKDSTAWLYCAYVDGIDSWVFATTSDLIDDLCEKFDFKSTYAERVKDNTYLVFSGSTGTMVSNATIVPRGRTAYENSYMGTSMSYAKGSTWTEYDETRWANYQEKTYDQRVQEHANTQGGTVLDMTKTRTPEINNAVLPTVQSETHFPRSEADVSKMTDEEIMFPDAKLFFEEISQLADSSYTFFDYHDESITYETFMLLEPEEQLYCTVLREDGTIVCAEDYENKRLMTGR